MAEAVCVIPTKAGLIAVVDGDDFDLIRDLRWRLRRVRSYRYAAATTGRRPHRSVVYLHRLLLGLDDRSLVGDHINGDGLDNRRHNLRVATVAQNRANSHGLVARERGLPKGVRHRWSGWEVSLEDRGVYHHVGTFGSEEAAVAAYEAAARERWGEFARSVHEEPLHRYEIEQDEVSNLVAALTPRPSLAAAVGQRDVVRLDADHLDHLRRGDLLVPALARRLEVCRAA